jgi:hypothetical protein
MRSGEAHKSFTMSNFFPTTKALRRYYTTVSEGREGKWEGWEGWRAERPERAGRGRSEERGEGS